MDGLIAPLLLASAIASGCPSLPPPRVAVRTNSREVVSDFSLGIGDLNRLSASVDSVSAIHTSGVGGLTVGSFRVTWATRPRTIQIEGSALSCIWVQSVDVTVDVVPTVYVAREFPAGTCAHRVIWEHELKHVEVDRRVANEELPRLRRDIGRALLNLGALGPLAEADLQAAIIRVVAHVDQAVSTRVAALNEVRRRRQQAIDSPREYDRIAGSCNGAVRAPFLRPR